MQGRDVATVIGIIILVILVLGLLGGGMMWTGMMGYGGYGGFVFSPLWGIVMIVFWLLVVGGIVWLVVSLFQQGRPSGMGPTVTGDTALNILRERYAKGEITREQYEQMRHDLEGK